MFSFASWWSPVPRSSRFVVDAVRVSVAVIIATHPLHALLSPDDAVALADRLASRGVPAGHVLAWLGFVLALVGSLGLLTRRFAFAGAVVASVSIFGGAVLLYAPRWYVVGGLAVEGEPGIELNVLLLGCLAAVMWTYRPRHDPRVAADRGLEIIRVMSAIALIWHGAPCFLFRDVEGMRAWGNGMTELGWPHGVLLVWSIKSVELVGALLRLSRRLVVPACVGHLAYLVPALWIQHELDWFNVGPDEGGIEFPLLIIICSIACIVGYWPRSTPAAEGARPALVR